MSINYGASYGKEQIDKAVALRKEGHTLDKIANETGIPRGSLSNIFRIKGLPVGKYIRITEDMGKELLRLYTQTKIPVSEIAKKLDVNTNTVQSYILRHIPTKTRRKRKTEDTDAAKDMFAELKEESSCNENTYMLFGKIVAMLGNNAELKLMLKGYLEHEN